jgi:hypothetical protein
MQLRKRRRLGRTSRFESQTPAKIAGALWMARIVWRGIRT